MAIEAKRGCGYRKVDEIARMVDKLICSANEKGEVGVVTWLCALRTDITLLLKPSEPKESV